MHPATLLRAATVTAAVLLAPPAGRAQTITLGQKDTFTGAAPGGFDNWTQGAFAPPGSLLLVTGGPGGGSDQYMQITATGGIGAGSRITVFNQVQWTGNYITAGVSSVEMDLRAPTTNTQSLAMRVAYKNALGAGYSSTVPFTLPADGQWHHAVFKLTAADMTAIGSPGSFDTFMTNPSEMRILNSSAPSLNGDSIAAVVGVDNVLAAGAPVPEPAGVLAAAALAAGAAWPLLRRRRDRRDVGCEGR